MEIKRNYKDSIFCQLFNTPKYTRELYCIYTGDKKDKPDTLKLSEVFFDGKPSDIEVTVHMLYGDKDDVINQYRLLCNKLHNRLKKEYEEKQYFDIESLKNELDTCYNEGILKEFVDKLRREMVSLYPLHESMTQEYASKMYEYEVEDRINKGIEQGFEQGHQEGIEQGQLTAYIQMYKDGILSLQQLKSYTSLDDASLKELLK